MLKANTILQKVRVYEIQIQSYTAQNCQQEALDIGVQVLKTLGVVMPNKPTMLHILAAVVETKLTLFRKRIEDLAALPTMTVSYKLAAMQILMLIVPAAAQAGSLLFPLIILAMVRLSVKYGNSAVAAFGYTVYGGMLCDKFGDIEAGYRFGKLGLALLNNINSKSLKCKVYFVFNAFIRHFKEPVKETIAPLQEAIHSGLETGDIEHTSYNVWTLIYNLFWSGQNLELVEQKLVNYIQLLQNLKLEVVALSISVLRQTILNLKGQSLDKYALIGEAFHEVEMISCFRGNPAWLGALSVSKTFINYLFKNYKETIKNARSTEKYQASSSSFLMYSVSNFYYSLALLAEFNNAPLFEQKLYLKQVAVNQKKMRQWAYHAPSNYQHKYELVEAEKARILGKKVRVMDLYDSAIALAKENGYIQEQALANELAAEFYLALDKTNIAKTYMTEAYYGYINWGAIAKVTDLDERYPNSIIRSYSLTTATDITRNITTHTTKTTSTTTSSSQILDLATVMKASVAISSEIILNDLLVKLLNIILQNVGAQKGCLILVKDNQLFIEAIATREHSSVVLQSILMETSEEIPKSVINYVARTQQPLILNNKTSKDLFPNDSYILRYQPQSVLCTPISYQGKLIGIFYLENNLATEAFTSERLELLKLLTNQAAIAIENARLYTREQEKSQQLQQSLQKLYSTQAQLVQTEKISSLGQLVAGIAHEVNNPVSFIAGNLSHANQYVEDFIHLLHLYQKYLPDPPVEIAEEIEAIDLEYLLSDLPKMISSMKLGTNRIRDIMQSLRNFSRADGDDKKMVDIHEGLETTLMILQHRLKASSSRAAIEVIKEYSDLPLVECYSGQLNQVFMNLLANAIDALDEGIGDGAWGMAITERTHCPTIRIRTIAHNSDAIVRIADKGLGMTEPVQQRLFDAFFTTKPEGKGTGLGLSISYQIITEKHGGVLKCISSPGKGAEFIIHLPLHY
ncbi:ATP-binding protein [Scytonema sp. NUACC26]|uniref:ATP-binding protein n=1 Tax=Scytonema sp. NUACC26 TaxID=3140176 RepID=UPI0034DC10E2